MRSTILVFHRISPERDPLWDPMPPGLFEKILDYVVKKYAVVSLRDFFQQPHKKYRKPALIITFDDGYRDFIEYGLPILQKYALPSIMFIVTECVESGLPTWTHILECLFSHSQKLEIRDLDFNLLGKGFQTMQWRDKTERMEYCKNVLPYLKKISNDKRKLILSQMIRCFDDVILPKGLMLNWDQVIQLKNAGVEIGSHTVSHPSLATIEDEKELEFELSHSAKLIEEKIGQFPIAISYPVGSYNQRVKNASKKIGYKFGLAVNDEIYDSLNADIFEIPRIGLYNESFFKAKLRINGTITKLKKFLHNTGIKYPSFNPSKYGRFRLWTYS